MKPLLLAAVNAKYAHASLAMRTLRANLGALRDVSLLQEFTINDPPEEIARDLLARDPCLLALGVYIWNRRQMEELVRTLRRDAPDLPLVLGGPEIAHDTDSALAGLATVVVCGEGEKVFGDLCRDLLDGRSVPRVCQASPPDLHQLVLPYDEYSEVDLRQRVLYVETSRGCPRSCAYCLSAHDPGLRLFPLERLLPAFERLLARGARRFKFTDRSFNLPHEHALTVLDFFASHASPELRLHLELLPPLRPDLLAALRRFPAGAIHAEVGVQTLNADVSLAVGRTARPETALATVEALQREAHAEVHADLIAGLPGEDLASFRQGFNRLASLRPVELQVGILKRLRGAPLHDQAGEQGLIFSPDPPYEILSTPQLSRNELQCVKRFAAHWERIANRHAAPRALQRLLFGSRSNPWDAFDCASQSLEEHGLHGIDLLTSLRALLQVLTEDFGHPPEDVKAELRADYLCGGKRQNVPRFLR